MSDTETKGQAGEQLADTQAQASAENAAADVTGEAGADPAALDKDLAMVEAGVAAFGRLGIEVSDEQDPEPQALIDGLNAAADTIERQAGQIDELARKLLELDLRGAEDGGAVEVAKIRLDELVAVRAERDALVAKFKEIENAPKAKAAKAPKPRKVGPLEADLSTDDLFELVRSAKRVEVAFSNGKTEIAHLPAQVIEGDAWRVGVNGLRLEGVTLTASGPASLVGYGLFLDGELAAYRARSDVLEITSGHTMSLAGDVVF